MFDVHPYFGFQQNLHATKSLPELIAAAIFPVSFIEAIC